MMGVERGGKSKVGGEGVRGGERRKGQNEQITAGSSRVVEINVARLIGATEECVCGQSGAQLSIDAFCIYMFATCNRSFAL